MIAMNITASVFVLNLNNMGLRGYHVPEIIQTITLFQAKVIFIKVPFMVRESWALDDEEPKKETPAEVEETPIEVFTLDQDVFNPPNCNPPPKYEPSAKKEKSLKKKDSSYQMQVKPLKKQVEEEADYTSFKDPFERRALAALEAMTKIFTKESEASKKTTLRKNLVDEWQFVSRVLDRTLFIAFSFSCMLFNIFILTSSPFRERFDYCPLEGEGSCDELTFEDIKQLTIDMASNYHGSKGDGGGGHGGGGHGGGGHGGGGH
ncbi:uncharacterized protein [Palaemon carinicauda]|uniref:uncharacterized protein n=1 Tax=Palaemon carinicauda TaxID=392227 RepID=UPI0035B5B279